jgi:hypothetical protein
MEIMNADGQTILVTIYDINNQSRSPFHPPGGLFLESDPPTHPRLGV